MAIRLLPESAEALHARGLLYQRQGMHPQAILDFDATIDRNPFVARALRGPRPELRGDATSTTRRSRISTRRSTSTTATPIPGPGAASPTSARATGRRRIESYQRALAIDNGNSVAGKGNSRL